MPVAVVKYIDNVYILFTAKVSCNIQSGLTSSNYNSKFVIKHILQYVVFSIYYDLLLKILESKNSVFLSKY